MGLAVFEHASAEEVEWGVARPIWAWSSHPDCRATGQKRSNATHASTTDPNALLYRKGPELEARLCYFGHGLMENCSCLIVDIRLTKVSGHADRLAALGMIEPWGERSRAITLGAHKG